jgi:anti-sigma B factor antagonist
MKIENVGKCLSISEIPELTALNSSRFQDDVRSALVDSPSVIEINLSQTRFMDSSGLGALFALYRATGPRNGVALRLLNPVPEIEQLLELTQMHVLFEIVRR